MARGYTAETKYIASIWPGELQPIAKNIGPDPKVNSPRRTVYKLQPVQRGGKAYVIEVADAFENQLDVIRASGGNNKQYRSNLVPCEEILRNILDEWTGNLISAPPNAGLGIMEIQGPSGISRTKELPVPTSYELNQMVERQTVLAEYLYSEGCRLARENQWKEITGDMRTLSRWLGKREPWIDPARASDMINCPACKSIIEGDALICIHCHTQLKTLPAELAKLNPISEVRA